MNLCPYDNTELTDQLKYISDIRFVCNGCYRPFKIVNGKIIDLEKEPKMKKDSCIELDL